VKEITIADLARYDAVKQVSIFLISVLWRCDVVNRDFVGDLKRQEGFRGTMMEGVAIMIPLDHLSRVLSLPVKPQRHSQVHSSSRVCMCVHVRTNSAPTPQHIVNG